MLTIDPAVARHLGPVRKAVQIQRARLRQRLDDLSREDPDTGCRIWVGRLSVPSGSHIGGYGRIRVRRADGSWTTRSAHVVAWELEHGKLPAGLVIDHLCSRRACIALPHLDPCSQGENVRRSVARRKAALESGHGEGRA